MKTQSEQLAQLKQVIEDLKKLKARKLDFLDFVQKKKEQYANEGLSLNKLLLDNEKEWAGSIQKTIDYIFQQLEPLWGIIEIHRSKTYPTKTLKDMISCGYDGYTMNPEDMEIYMTGGIQELERIADELSKAESQPVDARKGGTPKVFISYSHDSDEHKKWVLNLAIKLCENGVDVILDQWNLRLGGDVAKFMGSSTDADRVLMICTEKYVKKADEGKGGVGYEAMIVTGELMHNLETTKFIPVIRQNSSEIKVPKFVSTRAYINLSSEQSFEQEYERLLRDLHQAPAVSKPPIGKNPFIAQPSSTDDGENEQSQKGQAKMRSVSFRKNSPLYSVTKQKITKLCETLKRENLTPWFWFNSRGVRNIPRFDGGAINIGGGTYDSSQAMVFWESIKPFLQDAIVKTLDGTLETCRIRGLKPEEPYIRETAMLLDGHLIDPIYRYMAEIDQRIRGQGNPKSVKRRDVTDEITEMVKFLDECKDKMIQGVKEQNELNNKASGGEGQKKQMWFISFIKSAYHITVKAITEAMIGK